MLNPENTCISTFGCDFVILSDLAPENLPSYLTSMAPLADFLLSCIPYRLPLYLSTYVIGKTPLSTTPVVISMLAGYLGVVFGTRAFMMNRQPYKLTTLFQLHNIILSSGSALLLALMLEEIVPRIWRHGIRHAICDQEAWTSVGIIRCLSPTGC